MRVLPIIILIGWAIVGLINLSGDWRAVSKLDYGLCWSVLMLSLISNCLK